MNKFITPVIALLLFCANYTAAQPITLSLGSKTAAVGQQVCIPLTVGSGFNAVIGIQTSIRYDPNSLQPVSAGNINLPGLALNNFSIKIPGVTPSANTPGAIIMAWTSPNILVGETLASGTVLIEICFNVLSTATASTQLTFSNTPTVTEIINADEDELVLTGQPSTVTVTGGGGGGGNTPFKIITSNETVATGQKVCANVSVEGFKDLISVQSSIQYDPTKLRFDSVSGFNLEDLTVNSFGLPGSSTLQPGQIILSWSDPGTEGVTVPDGRIIFRLCFTAIGGNGSTPISFTTTPRAQEVKDKNQATVTFSSQNGSVTITGGTTGGGGTNSTIFKLNVPVKAGPSGTNVCLDITTEGFNLVASMSFSIQFDPTKLQYVSTGAYNLPGLTASNFGPPSMGGVPAGKLTLVWEEPTTQGMTVPDGTSIFQVCFKILATTGTTPVSIVGNPTPLDVLQVVNGNLTQGVFSSKPGSVTVGTTPVEGSEFKLTLSDKTVQSGQQVCLDVSVTNFKKLVSMQFTLGYDATKLTFDSITSLNLQYLSLSKIGTPKSPQPTTAGIITAIWEDESTTGLTVPNGTIIFKVCFTATGANGTVTNVNFINAPTSIEISDTSGVAIPFAIKNGVVTIGTPVLSPTIVNPPAITNINCFGQSTGAINITPQGGSGVYTYRWSNNATTQDLTGLAPGSYTVTVTDANTLTVTGTYSITQPTAALAVTSTVTKPSCTNPNSGSITVAVTGGTAPYLYNWSGSLPDNVPTQNNLQAGDYSVVITDAKGCTVSSGPINVALNTTLQISTTPTNISAGNTGSVTVNVTGGTGTYTYSWTGPGVPPFTSTQKDITGLSAPGQYCVTVTDVLGCSKTSCASVTAPLNVTGIANRICDGASDGAITLTVTGGVVPYRFNWSNGSTAQNLAGVVAGTYRVTITDNQNATNTSDFEVTKYPAIVLSETITPASAGVSNGAIALNISGGTSPYTILWANNATTATLNNLATGSYCVTVTDSRGCKKDTCYNVTVQDIQLSVANIQITSATCFGGNNGTLSFEIKGGRSPYTITFSNGTSITNTTGFVSRTDLTAGDLAFTVSDEAGARVPQVVQIAQPVGIQLTNIVVVNDTEESGCIGKITTAITGGKPPYTIQWNSPNTGNGTQIINLCEGDFVPTVRDSNGCVQTFPAITVNTFRTSGSVKPAQCPQDSTGSVILSISGGKLPYRVMWNNSTGNAISTSDTLKNVVPGVYTAVVTEQSGNTLIKQFTVNAVSNLNADIAVISDYNGSDISCPTAKDAILEVTGRNGSSGNYTYQWRRDTALLATTPVLMNVGAGTYRVLVTDGIGCTMTKEIKVVAPDTIKILSNIRDVSCRGDRNGEIIVTAIGGTSGRPYNFKWNTNAVTDRLLFLAIGIYQVTATDVNNCTATASFTLANPNPILVQVETQPATDDCNGVAFAKVEGGAAPYTFQWNSFPNQTQPMIDNLCPGPYFVKVTDSRGCNAELATGAVADSRFPCSEVRTVITPNGDGPNDAFLITCIQELKDNHLEIYNRWGQLVYQVDNYDNTWEGTTQNGDPLPEGPYYYVLEYLDNDGKLLQVKGSITLLRDN